MADVDLGTKKPGETGTGSVSLAHPTPGDAGASDATASISGGFAFLIGGSPATSAPVPVAGATPTVQYVVQAAEAAGTKAGAITGAAADKTLEVTVAHALTVNGPLAFGSKAVGTSGNLTLEVTNQTDATATIAVSPATHYSLASSSVAPGTGVTTVVVTFLPTAVGAHVATITVTAGSLTQTCSLAGEGVEAGFASSTTDSDGDGTISESEVKTTYKVHVPTESTRMHLGAAVSPFGTALDGFGLQTTGKGLLQATGNIGINSSDGDIRIQAQADSGNILAVSGGNSVFAAKGNSYVVGDGGVLITTALDVTTKVGNSTSGPDDGIPNADDMTTGSTVAAGVFTALDAIIAAASFARVIKTTTWSDFEFKRSRKAASVGAAVVSGGAALTATALGTISVLGNIDGFSPSVPGVTIYGHAGVLVGTPGFGGFYAAAGLVLGSIFPLVIGMDSEILGIRSVGVTGNDVTVDGWRDVEIGAGKAALLKAKEKVELAVAKKESTLTMEEKSLVIVVGEFAVSVTADGVKIGSNKDGAVDPDLPMMWVDATDAYLNGPGKSGKHSFLKLKDGEAALNGGTSTAAAGQLQLEDNKATLWAKSSKLTIDGAAKEISLKATTLKAAGDGKLELKGGKINIG